MQHYPRNTVRVTKYCPTCKRMTMHRVDDRRVGVCTEQHVNGMSKAQKKRAEKNNRANENENLF